MDSDILCNKIILGPTMQGLNGDVHVINTGKNDDGDPRRIFLETEQGRKPLTVGKVQIQQNNIKVTLHQRLTPLFQTFYDMDVEGAFLHQGQLVLNHLHKGGRVLDEKDLYYLSIFIVVMRT